MPFEIVRNDITRNDVDRNNVVNESNKVNAPQLLNKEQQVMSERHKTSNVQILKDNDDALTGDDVREGLTMIISCKHPDPQFEGQTKTKLGNAEVRKIADDVFSNGLERYLLENPDESKKIVEKSMTASKARLAAKKARELTRRKGDLDITNFYGKLSDCKSKDPSECEIFIVEGDSAGGSAIKGRDSMTQAILPLRGKILNVEKARLDKALNNEEIRTIITAFGTGIGEEFDLSKLRYNKIIIMTDADVDGAHIRVLLLTLFYRFFRPLVEAGHVYAAQPPLFCIKHGQTIKYVLDEKERDEYLATLKPETKRDILRMKGLGEMDAEELNETTMDINKRVLRQITVDDAIDVLVEETTEDISKMAAVTPIQQSYFKTGVFQHSLSRILWLIVLMISATVTGFIITYYENAFQAVPLLIACLPLLMGTGGNCGSQASTMVIRGLAVDEMSTKDVLKVWFKEIRISLVVGIVLAIVNTIRVFLLYGFSQEIILLAITNALALLFTVSLAQTLGCLLPIGAKVIKLDPAIMAAPVITTIVDALSVTVFFACAVWVFGM